MERVLCLPSAAYVVVPLLGLFPAMATPERDAADDRGQAPLRLTSAAFGAGGTIPEKHTCDGANVPPALGWSAPPMGTRSFALVVSDPDAQTVVGYTWMHWILYGLSPDSRGLPEGFAPASTSARAARAGKNHFGRKDYGGPCPPKGPAHHYYFTLYALDAALGLSEGMSAEALMAAMKGHVLATGQLIGTYARK